MVNAVSFATQAVANPTRYYKRPRDVIRDRRLVHKEKLAILEAWEMEARNLSVAAEESMHGGEPSLLEEVVQARVDLGEYTGPRELSGAPTKHGLRRAQPQHHE